MIYLNKHWWFSLYRALTSSKISGIPPVLHLHFTEKTEGGWGWGWGRSDLLKAICYQHRPKGRNTHPQAQHSFSSLAPSHFLWYLQWVSLRNSLALRSSLLSGSEQHLDICEPFRGKRILQLPKSQLMLAAMRRQRKEEFSPGMLTSMSKDLGSSRGPFLTQSFS